MDHSAPDYLQRQEAYRLTMLANQPTLRDQFAMAALSSLLSSFDKFPGSTIAAQRAYEIAGAMMVEREKQD